MSGAVLVKEQNNTVRQAVNDALLQAGFEILDEGAEVETTVVLSVQRNNQPEILELLSELPEHAEAVLLALREQDLNKDLSTHERVVSVLMKPFRPNELVAAIKGVEFEEFVQSSDPHVAETADRARVAPTSAYDSVAPERTPHTIDDPSSQQAKVTPFHQGAVTAKHQVAPAPVPAPEPVELVEKRSRTEEGPSIWHALGHEIARMVPEWAAVDDVEERTAAIADWLDQRSDD